MSEIERMAEAGLRAIGGTVIVLDEVNGSPGPWYGVRYANGEEYGFGKDRGVLLGCVTRRCSVTDALCALADRDARLSAALDALEAWVTWERETLATLAGVRLREPLPPSPTETTRALLVTAGRKP